MFQTYRHTHTLTLCCVWQWQSFIFFPTRRTVLPSLSTFLFLCNSLSSPVNVIILCVCECQHVSLHFLFFFCTVNLCLSFEDKSVLFTNKPCPNCCKEYLVLNWFACTNVSFSLFLLYLLGKLTQSQRSLC